MIQIKWILPVIIILLFFGCCHAVTLLWNESATATGYKLYWGTESGVYEFSEDVGDVLEAVVEIPEDSYIAATAYNDYGESGYSNEIYYELAEPQGIQPASGGQIYTMLIQGPTGDKAAHGDGYGVQWSKGRWIIIHDNLDSGDNVRLGY